jgi:hypothetical protein
MIDCGERRMNVGVAMRLREAHGRHDRVGLRAGAVTSLGTSDPDRWLPAEGVQQKNPQKARPAIWRRLAP